MKDYFDRIVCLNLDRRQDRWKRFESRLREADWPFGPVIRVRAVDGVKTGGPRHWACRLGVWGCFRSHVRVLEDAINEDVARLLVLEDDATFSDHFAAGVTRFLKAVPSDWNQLFLGGRHRHEVEIINDEVVRSRRVILTHAYAIQGEFIRTMYRFLCSFPTDSTGDGFCDVDQMMSLLHLDPAHRVYAPTRWLIEQDKTPSDTRPQQYIDRFQVPDPVELAGIAVQNPPRWHRPVPMLSGRRKTIATLQKDVFHPPAPAQGSDQGGEHSVFLSAPATPSSKGEPTMTIPVSDPIKPEIALSPESPAGTMIERATCCRSCPMAHSIEDSGVRCEFRPSRLTLFSSGVCGLRKWPGSRAHGPLSLTHAKRRTVQLPQGDDRIAVRSDISVNPTRATETVTDPDPLRFYTPQQRALIEARKSICSTCPENRGLTRLTVKCMACGCSGISLATGRCKHRKWPKSVEVVADDPHSKGSAHAQDQPTIGVQPVLTDLIQSQHPESSDETAIGRIRSKSTAPPPAPRSRLFTAALAPLPLEGMYRGRSAFLICGGPSFAELDHQPLRQPGILTMAVNNAAKTFRPNLWACVDDPGNFLRSIWLDPTILKFCPIAVNQKSIFDSDAWSWMGRCVADCPATWFFTRNGKFIADQWLAEDTFNWGNATRFGGGRSVMLVAMKLLYILGVKRVFLLGADFRMDAKTPYHFDQARNEASRLNNQTTYAKLTKWLGELQPRFQTAGFQVFNCNPNSELKVFPTLDYGAAIESSLTEWGNIHLETERTAGLYDQKKP